AHHARIDDELKMRGEPGFFERPLHRAIGVRDDSDDQPGVTRTLKGLRRFAVGLVAQPDRDVEAAPPFGDRGPFRVVLDSEIVHQIADVASPSPYARESPAPPARRRDERARAARPRSRPPRRESGLATPGT